MRYFISGGLGFIGSNLARRLLDSFPYCEVVVYDNLSNGKTSFLRDARIDKRLKIVIGDIKDKNTLIKSMAGSDVVYHFASNADIAKAISDPTVDFYDGTLLTLFILEAMRITGVKKLVYASGSGIYGDWSDVELSEDHSPMMPISPYGASKLAGEAMISSYCHMFDMQARVYRFANVVGRNQTHGVGYVFANQLMAHPDYLDILGRGNQSKSYIHVSDVLNAIAKPNFETKNSYEYYNVATKDYITVMQIAEIVKNVMGIENTKYVFHGDEEGGWKGDVPVVRINSDKIRKTGWANKYSSYQAMDESIKEMMEDFYGQVV